MRVQLLRPLTRAPKGTTAAQAHRLPSLQGIQTAHASLVCISGYGAPNMPEHACGGMLARVCGSAPDATH